MGKEIRDFIKTAKHPPEPCNPKPPDIEIDAEYPVFCSCGKQIDPKLVSCIECERDLRSAAAAMAGDI